MDRRKHLFAALIALLCIALLGCGGGFTTDVSAGPTVTAANTIAAPTLAEMEQVLQAELERLGKSTLQAGDYIAPSGDVNIPFDLHAQVIDPDGEGGADPLGVHVSWTERLAGDYNMDGLVNASDLTPLGQYYNRTVEYRDASTTGGVECWPTGTAMDELVPTSPNNWRLSRVDGNGDGLINMQDITAIGQHWQEQLTGYQFLIQRQGANPEVYRDPENPGEVYEVPFHSSPLTEIFAERWPNVQVYHEINLPCEISAGDTVCVIPLSHGINAGLLYETTAVVERPWWLADVLPGSYSPSRGSLAVRVYAGDECQGIFFDWPEYFHGDLDGNGTVHVLESSLQIYYYGNHVEDLQEPERSIVDRLDWNGNGLIETGDLSDIGVNHHQRIDGIAFQFPDGADGFSPVMSPTTPDRRLILSRPFNIRPFTDHVYRCWLADRPGVEKIYPSVVSAAAADRMIGDPYYSVSLIDGASSSIPEDGEPVIAVIAPTGRAWLQWPPTTMMRVTAQASYSLAGEITLYEWDIDGDGIFGDVKPYEVGVGEYVFPYEPGDYPIGVRITDDQGNVAAVSMTVTVPE